MGEKADDSNITFLGIEAIQLCSEIMVAPLVQSSPHFAWLPRFQFTGEDHTLGNSLRYMLMKDPNVEFAGYTVLGPAHKKVLKHADLSCSTETSRFRWTKLFLHGRCLILLSRK